MGLTVSACHADWNEIAEEKLKEDNNVSYYYEAIAGSRSSLVIKPQVESQDGYLYLYGAQWDYIIDLQQTVKKFDEAYVY